MTRPRRFLPLLLTLPLLLWAAPAPAQEADTTEADTAAPDTTAPAEPAPAEEDTSAAAAPAPTDTAQAAADAETAPDTLTAAERRARAKEQAEAAAASWLSLTDAGRFEESWDAAAPLLREGLSREQWTRRGTRVRSRLDTLTSRTLTRARYRDSTRQIPGGRPVVALQYETQFGEESVLEAVITTKQEADWAVAGYRIVPRPDAAQPDSTQAAPDSAQAPSDSTQTQSP